jgi:hypothetical protein
VLVVLRVGPKIDIIEQLSLRPDLLAAIAAVSIPAALAIWAIAGSRPKNRALVVLACCMASLFAVKVGVLEPAQDRNGTSAAFVSSVERSRQAGAADAPLVFVGLGPDNQDLDYLAAAKSAEHPDYIYKLDNINSITTPATIILRQKTLDQFVAVCNRTWKEIARGKLGHTDVIAVRLSDSGG